MISTSGPLTLLKLSYILHSTHLGIRYCSSFSYLLPAAYQAIDDGYAVACVQQCFCCKLQISSIIVSLQKFKCVFNSSDDFLHLEPNGIFAFWCVSVLLFSVPGIFKRLAFCLLFASIAELVLCFYIGSKTHMEGSSPTGSDPTCW